MPLERQVIEKKDFPIGRRGYDPEAVDAHLQAIADEVDSLKSNSRRRTETLATNASAQVRAIVEAAESSAAAITRQAEDDAAEIRAEASQEAAVARQQANSQARDYVGQVSESTAVMLQRLDAMESELSALLEALRTGSNRLGADLQLLEGNLDDVKQSVRPRPSFEPEAPGYSAPAARSVSSFEPPAPAPVYEEPAYQEPVREVPAYEPPPAPPAPAYEPPAPVAEPEPEPLPPAPEPVTAAEPAPRRSAPAAAEDDVEGARLVALNMALNGTPRDETDRYLAENFALGDRARLLDEVYASVEG